MRATPVLVKNAIKYTDEGSIEFGYNYTEELTFFVKDTGIGIPADRQESVFERFVQADIEDFHARQGAGLGLSIAKAFVEMLGGRIWLESVEGEGSSFYFSIPLN
jgi:signal transduction histidine kinase